MDIYPLKICGSGYDIISKKSGYDPVLEIAAKSSDFGEFQFSDELFIIEEKNFYASLWRILLLSAATSAGIKPL